MRNLLFVPALVCALPAAAGTITVQVRDAKGAPVANAVVTVHLQGRATPAPRTGGHYEIEQKNIQFNPYVTIVPVNSDISFPNRDAVRHHVYSFSPARKFELKLYAKEQDRTVRFDKPGIVPVGCNIHDAMSAFVAVVDTPWAVKTDTSGIARIAGVPDGGAAVEVWHPWLRAPGNRVVRVVRVTGTGVAEAFAVQIRPTK
jgi:plastocyanin